MSYPAVPIETIRIRDLIRTGHKEMTVEEEYTYEDLPVIHPVKVALRIQLTSTGVTVLGKFKATLEEPCDRCLEPFTRPITRNFEERFVYESFIDSMPTGDMELHSEDFYETIGPDGIVDLKDLVYQYIILAMSTDRVCERDTCTIHSDF